MTTSATPTNHRSRREGPVSAERRIRSRDAQTVDTRRFWLIRSIGLITLAVMIGLLAGNRNKPRIWSFGEIFGLMNIPTAIILPVMAILLVTGEWESAHRAHHIRGWNPRRSGGHRQTRRRIRRRGGGAVAPVPLGAIGTVIAGISFRSGRAVVIFVECVCHPDLRSAARFGFAALIPSRGCDCRLLRAAAHRSE